MKRIIGCICFLFLFVNTILAQYTLGTTGLLHMPNAEMQKDGTCIIGGNFLNKHNLPNTQWWGYDTYNYFINLTVFDRVEISYICTLFKGKKENKYWPEQTWGKFCNQDRHFAARLQVVKEGEWWKYMPSIVFGVNDPTTSGGGGDFTEMEITADSNGYFNRWFIAVTKHFNIPWGDLGTHVTYLYNKRTDYPLNGPAFGMNFRPNFHKNLNLIAEYDAKTINLGAIYSIWADHFNLLLELQEGKYISVGLVYKVNLKGGNKWNNKILDF